MKTVIEKMNMRIVLDDSEDGYYGIGSNCKSIEASSEAIVNALHDADIFPDDEPHEADDITYSNDDVLVMAEMLIDFGSALSGQLFTKAVWFD